MFWLTARSLLWTMLLPGVVAGYVPWRYFGLRGARIDFSSPRHILAAVLIVAGASLLGACILDFARRGRGTLSPADPPRHLVVQGVYQHVRNPMYLAVSAMLWGEWLLVPSAALALYWLAFFTAANVFVMGYEEPYLRSRFGESYEAYARRVGRWIP
jgi:protein-S-isoprenylcysteine O-methyltransferase Ste14